ncbi:LysM peptidoglycan-binding domain-containing protein [Nocardia wallacei]|uniref:LysM peptidoglycan-binding domain-containing protein n=1 Tax=Nocardia wallacei TaxID=480035 RepID=UPI002458DA49|nr:LysM peptidoglycan-binding domain-containing protein [Nocardia wallacei]
MRASAPAGESTAVVQVGAGESLSEVAARVAPGVPVRDTVRKIVELNGLRGAEVSSGRTLIVPASGR